MQELRSARRSLRSTPVVTAAAVLSLALGIGANTAIGRNTTWLNVVLRVRPGMSIASAADACGRRSRGSPTRHGPFSRGALIS